MPSHTLVLPFTPAKALRFVLALHLAALLFLCAHDREMLRAPSSLGNALSFVTISSLLVYVLGNYERTLRASKRYLLFLPLVLASMFVFHWLGEQDSLRNNLSTTRNWDGTARAVYYTTLGGIAVVLLLHAEYTRRHHRDLLPLYVASMLLPLGIIGMLYALALRFEGTRMVVHVHHWWIGFYVSFFTRYDVLASRLLAPIFIGVMVEGILDALHFRLFILDQS